MKTAAEILAFLELAALWLLIGLRYRTLPALIHSPFNGGGDAHGMGPKDQLWLLLILTSVFYVFVTAIARLPLPINVPAGTSPATVADIRRQIPQVFGVLKVCVLAFVLWLVLLATSTAVPPPHRNLLARLFLLALCVGVGVSFARLVLTLRRGTVNP
jgi:hypothetical protein